MNNNENFFSQSVNNPEIFRILLATSESLIRLLTFNYRQFNSNRMEGFFSSLKRNELKELTLSSKIFCQALITTLQDNISRNYLHLYVNNNNLNGVLSDFLRFLAESRSLISDVGIDEDSLYNYVEQFVELLHTTTDWIDNFNSVIYEKYKYEVQINTLQEKYANALAHIDKTNLKKTEELYSQASSKYSTGALVYEILFYLVFGGGFLFTIVHLAHVEYEGNEINYIVAKVMVITFVVTLGSIFLRKASHLRKLNDQAHQTSLELSALPLFLKNVKDEDHSDIYKELAGKYFGKEIDQSQNDKIGDLMTEQIKTSLELMKTNAEIMKSMKPNVTLKEETQPNQVSNLQ